MRALKRLLVATLIVLMQLLCCEVSIELHELQVRFRSSASRE